MRHRRRTDESLRLRPSTCCVRGDSVRRLARDAPRQRKPRSVHAAASAPTRRRAHVAQVGVRFLWALGRSRWILLSIDREPVVVAHHLHAVTDRSQCDVTGFGDRSVTKNRLNVDNTKSEKRFVSKCVAAKG